MGDSKPRRSVRCPHCAGPLAKEMETSDWTLPPLIRDSFSMIGSAVGCTTSAFYGFNHVMPIVQRWVKGPIWLHFLIGAPPVMVFSSACAGLTDRRSQRVKQIATRDLHNTYRWCCSSTCPTCIFIISFSILVSVIAISNLTG